MGVVSLSDEETVAILSETFTESLADLGDAARRLAVLKRLHTVLASPAPQRFIEETVEGCEELQVVRVGGDLRVFCRLVMAVPRDDPRYNVIFVFELTPHRYRGDRLATLDEAATERLHEATSVEGVVSTDAYLDRMDAFTADDLRDRIDRMGG